MIKEILELGDLPFPFDALGILQGILTLPKAMASEKLRLALLPWARQLAEETGSDIPPLDYVLRYYFAMPDMREQAETWLRQHNFGTTQINALLEVARQYPDVVTVLTFRRRGIYANDDIAKEYLAKLGFVSEDADDILKLTEIIPPITDIIRMAVREAFSPEAIEKFELEQHYPPELTPWAERQGLTEDWARKYWIAHWELPSIQQAFEMLWRTDFSEEDLDLLMRFADINPYFRPYIKAISYQPIGRVDLRRMYRDGIISAEKLPEFYRHLGYNPENAQRMADWSVRYETRSERAETQKFVLWSFKKGLIDHETCYHKLALLLQDPERAMLLADQAGAQKAVDHFDAQIAHIQKLYVSKRIEYAEASDMLDGLKLKGFVKLDYLQEWEQDRFAKERQLGKADLEKMLDAEILTPGEFDTYLSALGYTDVDIVRLLNLHGYGGDPGYERLNGGAGQLTGLGVKPPGD